MQSDEYDSLVDISSYARQLQEWRAHFPTKAILTVDFDQLIATPQAQLARILRHIGAAPMQIADLASHNDTAQLSRVPRPLMRLAHGRLRPLLLSVMGQRAQGRGCARCWPLPRAAARRDFPPRSMPSLAAIWPRTAPAFAR